MTICQCDRPAFRYFPKLPWSPSDVHSSSPRWNVEKQFSSSLLVYCWLVLHFLNAVRLHFMMCLRGQ